MTEQNTDTAAADPSGPGNGPQNVTEAPEDATVGDDTGAAWSDAFRPDNDGGFTPDQYQAAIEEMGLQDDEPEDTDAGRRRTRRRRRTSLPA